MSDAIIVRKGGKVALSELIRKLDEYELWRRSVFLRDRFTCQHCGARNGRKRVIQADHIKPFSILLDEFKITSVEEAVNCAGLWDVSNGRTLCRTCHEKTDSYPKRFIRKPKKKKRNGRHKERI